MTQSTDSLKDSAVKSQKADKKSKVTPSTMFFPFMTSLGFLLGVNNVYWCPPTSLGQATQGMSTEQEEQFAHSQPRHGGFGWREKKTPNIQNPSLRAIMWRIPPLSSSCGPLLSSSLLFFFNQAVWGCQVFWDEDSQPCEKLIPCGPSSPWRSSPWEHWWWLAGRWWWAEGGGREEGWMEGWTQGHPDQWIEWHRLSPIHQ